MTEQKKTLDDLTIKELKSFCDYEGITVSYCPDGGGYFWVSGSVAHEEGKGPFYHKEPTGDPGSLQEAYMAYLFQGAGISS